MLAEFVWLYVIFFFYFTWKMKQNVEGRVLTDLIETVCQSSVNLAFYS
jgi:hypothetical protein